MRSLLINDPTFEKVAGVPMGAKTAEWPQEIVVAVSNEHPYLMNKIKSVRFNDIDESKGDAFGVVQIEDGKEKAYVPIIIKNSELQPMDTFIYNKEVFYLSPVWMSKIFSKNSGYKKAISKTTYQTVEQGFRKEASAGDSILDAIAGMIRDKEKGNFMADITTDPSVISAFINNGTIDAINKIKNSTPVSTDDLIKALGLVIPKGMILVRKSGLPENYVVDGFSNYGYKVRKSMDKGHLEKYLKDNHNITDPSRIIHNIDKNGYVALQTGEYNSDVIIDSGMLPITSERLGFHGTCYVKSSAGKDLKGFMFPVVIDFNVERSENKMFIGKGFHAYQPEIAGNPDQKDDFKLEIEKPESGCYGTLIDETGKIATVPFTVNHIVFSGKYSILKVSPYEVKDHHGSMDSNITLIVTSGINTFIRINKIGDPLVDPYLTEHSFLIPETMQFVELGPRIKVASKPSEFEKVAQMLNKEAMYAEACCGPSNPDEYEPIGVYVSKRIALEMTYNSSKKTFSIHGDAARCLNWEERSDIDRATAKGAMLSMGIKEDKCDDILESVEKLKFIEVANIKQFEDFEKMASEYIKHVASFWTGASINLIKEASVLEDKESAENLLSMYFVSPENYYFFIEAIPQLEASSRKLSKLLLSARMGMNDISPEAIKKCLTSLDQMINKLNEAKLRLNMGQQ